MGAGGVEIKQKQDKVEEAMTSPRPPETSQHDQDIVVSEIERTDENEAAAAFLPSLFSDRNSQVLNIVLLCQNGKDEIQFQKKKKKKFYHRFESFQCRCFVGRK